MEITSELLKEILVTPGYVNAEQFNAAVGEAQSHHASIESVIVQKGIMRDDHLGQIIAEHFNYHFIDLRKREIADEMRDCIPEIVARTQLAIIIDHTPHGYQLATAHPDNYAFIKLLEKKLGEHIDLFYATPLSLEEALTYYKNSATGKIKDAIKILSADAENEGGIIAFVNLLLEHAYDNRASDIHIEPMKNEVNVRFRIDGILHEVTTYPKNLHEKIVFRVKIMSRIRTDEHAMAQDGRFDYSIGTNAFDVRVSVLPVTTGENVVMRLLSDRLRRLKLEELGFGEHALENVRNALKKPFGMIIAAGPTGSGKTSTLYAILEALSKAQLNIMTIEDPVEYDIPRIRQTQVNPNKNLTFATGLRSIVRQDPNIIMVGEIRDQETADIAINAAMTGHLLLSTLHANDAATTFPRLIEMGIEPFLLASSINVVIAQRLVRKNCSACTKSYLMSSDERDAIMADQNLKQAVQKMYRQENLSKIRFFTGQGCKTCAFTGYVGRTGIFEIMEITDQLRPLITQKTVYDIINNKARELGMVSMLEDGIAKVFQGITTLAEVIRVTKS